MSKSHPVNCPCCNKPIDPRTLDFACGLPDDIFSLVKQGPHELKARAKMTPDLCVLDDKRFFQRGLLAIPVEGSRQPFNYGVWFEVSFTDARRIHAAWDDAEAYMALRIKAKLANKIEPYAQPTLGIAVELAAKSQSQRLSAMSVDSPWLMALMTRGWTKAEHKEIAAKLLALSGPR